MKIQVEEFLKRKNVCHIIFYFNNENVGPQLRYVK